jgi:predicted dehydrogenase
MNGSSDVARTATRRRSPRIGVVGLGWWCRAFHLPALKALPSCEVVAACDLDAGRVADARDRFDIPHGFANPVELFASGLVDAVVIATPHDTHHDLAVAALGADLDVYVEKPLTLRAPDAREIELRARESGRQLMLGYTNQCSTIAQRLRRRIADGGLGPLVHVAGLSANCLRQLLEGQSGEAVFGDDRTATTDTYSTPERGGGQAYSQATHGLGLILYVTSLRPVAVSATMNMLDLSVDISDAIAITCEGGATIAMSSVGTIPNGLPEQQEFRYYGTDGYAIQDALAGTAAVFDGSGEEHWRDDEVAAGMGSVPMREFVRLLSEGGENYAPAGPAARVVEVLDAAHRSHREQRVVRVDEL